MEYCSFLIGDREGRTPDDGIGGGHKDESRGLLGIMEEARPALRWI